MATLFSSENLNQMDQTALEPGTVALVGAGPGDPGLLTIAAFKVLNIADVIIYDALVSDEILDMIPSECEMIFAGKRGGRASAKQEDICNRMIQYARDNRRVVRLKGGDPFVFGRGGEEAIALVQAGISFQVIPGITAGTAGPAYAGIPITHRAFNANVAFLTGHEAHPNSRIDWKTVGMAFPVLVLYMAISNLSHITRTLIACGRDPETPLAIIRWATTSHQQTLTTTLRKAPDDAVACKIEAPAIIVIGEVVALREQLAWFKDKTLVPHPDHSSHSSNIKPQV